MGYQESFVKFPNVEALNAALKEYYPRISDKDVAEIVCVDRVKKSLDKFKEGELVAVVCGERSAQRGPGTLEEYLGIKGAKDVIFMDKYWIQSEGDFDRFLNEHFEKIPLDEYMKEIGVEKPANFDYDKILSDLETLEQKERFINYLVIHLKNCFVESRHRLDALQKEHAENALEIAYQYGKTGKFPKWEDE